MHNPITNEKFPPLSDDCADCAVCKAMARAEKEGRELTAEELMRAMQEANIAQGRKGGFGSIGQNIADESPEQIIVRRKQIEHELINMLVKSKSDFSLQHIRDVIFHEEDTDDMMKIVAMFDNGGNAPDLENVLELASDAWNYFPHALLGGRSPAEMRVLRDPTLPKAQK